MNKIKSKSQSENRNNYRNRTSYRKGQMEIIGLVIIVILITLGMLLMASLALKSEPQKKTFTGKGLAYSTMSALMKTTISKEADCTSIGLPELGKNIIDDCARHLDSASQYNCIGPTTKQRLHSCDFLQEMSFYLLNATLGSWNKHYELHSQLLIFQEEKPIEIMSPVMVEGGCPQGKDRYSSGLFPINTESGLVENVLYLCD
ncbi:MAG: hypothetical protein AABW48_05620 [Nanoarchaeota archaeon]